MAKKLLSRPSRAMILRSAMRGNYAKPIVVRTTVIKKPKHRRSGGGGDGGGLTSKKRMGVAMGAAALGFIQKQGWAIPELPLIGEAGTIAVVAYYLSDNGRNKLADHICTAGIAIAAYELTSTGKVVGGQEEPWGSNGYVAGV